MPHLAHTNMHTYPDNPDILTAADTANKIHRSSSWVPPHVCPRLPSLPFSLDEERVRGLEIPEVGVEGAEGCVAAVSVWCVKGELATKTK